MEKNLCKKSFFKNDAGLANGGYSDKCYEKEKIALIVNHIKFNFYSNTWEVTEEPAKQVRSHKSTCFKLKFQTAKTVIEIPLECCLSFGTNHF